MLGVFCFGDHGYKAKHFNSVDFIFFYANIFSVCRAIGIPCRNVTNYVSAHDTDGSLSVDKFFDVDGETLGTSDNSAREDSVWNFHVWNEVWMRRNDLPEGLYGGWQVVDATPQETSNGTLICSSYCYVMV